MNNLWLRLCLEDGQEQNRHITVRASAIVGLNLMYKDGPGEDHSYECTMLRLVTGEQVEVLATMTDIVHACAVQPSTSGPQIVYIDKAQPGTIQLDHI